jgi:dihydroorotase
MREITIIQPDDWHCHLRDGEYLARTVPDTAHQFRRAIVMPNLAVPVTTAYEAKQYKQRILDHIPAGVDFDPLMTLYLTDRTTPQYILDAKNSGLVFGAKLYPQGATTHSEAGVTKIEKMYHTFESMSEHHLPLLVHGEINDPDIDIFDKEKHFIDKVLSHIVKNFPSLKIVLEHITTKEAVDFVTDAPDNVGATITPHHLMYDRNKIFQGGIKPHYYCLPILKRREHKQALISAATSGNPKFFLGTDSAPHTIARKESSCGCAGIYNVVAAIEFYTEVFAHAGKLNKLEAFSSLHGPNFYGLAPNDNTITLQEEPMRIPEKISFGSEQLHPMRSGQTVSWQIVS